MKIEELVTKSDIATLKEDIIREFLLTLEKAKSNSSHAKEWLTTKEVQDLFGVKSENTLQNLKKAGLRPGKLGGKNLYFYPDIVKFIKKEK